MWNVQTHSFSVSVSVYFCEISTGLIFAVYFLQCCDTVGLATGTAAKKLLQQTPKVLLRRPTSDWINKIQKPKIVVVVDFYLSLRRR